MSDTAARTTGTAAEVADTAAESAGGRASPPGQERRAARVAVLADIHGNLPALEAVLREVDAAGADLVVLLGYADADEWTREHVLSHYSDTEALAAFTHIAREQGGGAG